MKANLTATDTIAITGLRSEVAIENGKFCLLLDDREVMEQLAHLINVVQQESDENWPKCNGEVGEDGPQCNYCSRFMADCEGREEFHNG